MSMLTEPSFVVGGLPFAVEAPPIVSLVPKKDAFLPWHHPVKQVVRHHQWAELTKRLIAARPAARPTLRYFTLPGADLLDVRRPDLLHPNGSTLTKRPWGSTEFALLDSTSVCVVFRQW